MKFTLTLIMLLVSIFSANGQQDSVLRDKKDRIILPEKNNFAFGISINPIFDYLGNTFNGSQYNSLNLGLIYNQLYGKYFLSSNSALRFRLGIRTTNRDIQVNVGELLLIEEKFTEVDVTAGYERRNGKSRLQHFYGGEISIAYEEVKHEHDYRGFLPDNIGLRESEGLGVGLRGFFGIEYFVFPKLSLGGECGLGISSTDTFKAPDRKYSINTDILGGQIFMLYHFDL